MSFPENKEEKKDNDETCKRKQWDECIRRSTKRIAFGLIVGAVGSAIMGGSELPLRLCAGLTVGWSVNRCRRLFNPPPPPPPPPKPEDPCACCFSDFEPLIADEFEDTAKKNEEKEKPSSTNECSTPSPPSSRTPEEETKCTCEERLFEWSPPVPADKDSLEDFPECTCED